VLHQILLEVIVTNADEAALLNNSLVDRLELIHDFSLGGLSPSLTVSREVCEVSAVPVNVMVRPHGRDFVYNAQEMAQIFAEIDYLRDHTMANGIVFGSLDKQGLINEAQLQAVTARLGRLELTFHRAIDVSANFIQSFTTLSKYQGVKTVLTSGHFDSAIDGIANIKQAKAMNTHINILVGSGLNLDNVSYLIEQVHPSEIHLGSGVRTSGKLDQAKMQQLRLITA